jgi:hypothetical protein
LSLLYTWDPAFFFVFFFEPCDLIEPILLTLASSSPLSLRCLFSGLKPLVLCALALIEPALELVAKRGFSDSSLGSSTSNEEYRGSIAPDGYDGLPFETDWLFGPFELFLSDDLPFEEPLAFLERVFT